MSDSDSVRRFVLAGGGVRGQWVRLASVWEALREHVDYPAPVRDLLGEAACAAVLLASTLKFEGMLTLQLQGDGAVRLLVVQCNDRFELRALARFDAKAVRPDFQVLVGSGQMTVTVETGSSGTGRYQGIVPLVGDSLSRAIEHYCEQSEQLPTVLRLAADARVAGGVLLQRMPSEGGDILATAEQVNELWDQAAIELTDVEPLDLLTNDSETMARRCGAGEDVRVLAAQAVRFQCRCNPERIAGVLRSLGASELESLIAEQGAVTVTCEFCQKPWIFDAIDVAEIIKSAAPQPPASHRLN